jgi:hypothetical protein
MSGIIQSLIAGYGGILVEATGGIQTTISQGGTWRVHTFNSGGTFTVIEGGEVEYLVVGGGGGGGATQNERSREGRGGQVLIGNFIASPGNYAITIGGGGARISWPNGGRRGAGSALSGSGVSASAQGGAGGASRAFISGQVQEVSGQSGFAGNGSGGIISDINGAAAAYGNNGPFRTGSNTTVTNGLANSGRGGSNVQNSGSAQGGAGGSGVIILRYRTR